MYKVWKALGYLNEVEEVALAEAAKYNEEAQMGCTGQTREDCWGIYQGICARAELQRAGAHVASGHPVLRQLEGHWDGVAGPRGEADLLERAALVEGSVVRLVHLGYGENVNTFGIIVLPSDRRRSKLNE